jgi:hypothetical protein
MNVVSCWLPPDLRQTLEINPSQQEEPSDEGEGERDMKYGRKIRNLF